MVSKCQLCQAIFPSRKELIAYERIKHRINKTIPHRKLLNQPLLEQVVFYQDALIVFIKKCFGFNRYSIGTKQVSINAFPENIFGEDGELQSKQLVNYDYLNVLQDPKLKTISYVLFKDHDSSYVVNFSWSRSEFKENNCTFQYDTTTCKFITDLGKFSEQSAAMFQANQITSQAPGYQIDTNKSFSAKKLAQKNYQFILPRAPFQQLNK